MKQKTIKLFATQIPYAEEDLQENEVYVEFDVEELLDQIDNETIASYAKWNLGMLVEEDVAVELNDFSESELVEHLRDNYYNFSREVDVEDMIEYLEERGYSVNDVFFHKNEYDYVDNCLFDEISSIFYNLSCAERQELRDKIINTFK